MSDDHDNPRIADGAGPEAALAAEIRRRRKAAGLSQTDLAVRVGYSREYVSRAERPSKGLASAGLVCVLDDALDACGELVALRQNGVTARQSRRGVPGGAGIVPANSTAVAAADHEADLAAVTSTGSSSLTVLRTVLDPDQVLDVVDDFTGSVVHRYELEGPHLLAPEVHALRELSCGLAGRVDRDARERLARASDLHRSGNPRAAEKFSSALRDWRAAVGPAL